MNETSRAKAAQFLPVARELLDALARQRQNLAEIIQSLRDLTPPLREWEAEWYLSLGHAAHGYNPELENWALGKAAAAGMLDTEFLEAWRASHLELGKIADAAGLDLPLAELHSLGGGWDAACAALLRAAIVEPGPATSPDLAAQSALAAQCADWLGRNSPDRLVSLRAGLRKHLGYLLTGKPGQDFNLIALDFSATEFAGPEGRARCLEAFKILLAAPGTALREELLPTPDLRIVWSGPESGWCFTVTAGPSLPALPGLTELVKACAHLVYGGSGGRPIVGGLPISTRQPDSTADLAAREAWALANVPLMGFIFSRVFGVEGYAGDGVMDVMRRIATGASEYAATGSNTEDMYGTFVSFYCATSGLAADFMSFLVKLYNPPYPISIREGALGRYRASEVEVIAATLKRDGVFIFPDPLPSALVEALIRYGHTGPCFAKNDDGKAREAGRYPGMPMAQQYDFLERDLIEVPEVQTLVADPVLFAVSQAYLGAKPIMDAISMWWSTTFSKVASSEAAQLYHFDLDRIQWLKWFIYLSDVDTDTGPHCFIRGSHRSGRKPGELLQRGYQRIPDSDLERFFPKEDFLEITGKKGTVFVEDTSGFHKGKLPTKGPRLVLELEFTNSLFGTVFPRDIRVGADARPELLDAARAYPQLLRKYSLPR